MSWFIPSWKMPGGVEALITTREEGVSKPPFDSFNLGSHVGDQPQYISQNRAKLRQFLPAEPLWLNQIHGVEVSTPNKRFTNPGIPTADASVSNQSNEVLCILTADCLPVLFASKDGSVVGAAHAGWRGLCAGVLENTIKEMLVLSPHLGAAELIAYLGPAIGPQAFEVGEDVKKAFQESGIPIEPEDFIPLSNKPGKYLANLYSLAKSRLRSMGIEEILGGDKCTFNNKAQFFSYRRDGVTGRFASLIWLSS